MSAAMQGSWLAEARVYGTRAVALMAYSLYLSHKAVANVVYSLDPHFMDRHAGWAAAMIFPAVFAFASLLYMGVERPFLLLRDRRGRVAEDEALLDPERV